MTHEVQVNKDGKLTKVVCKPPKGRDTKRGLKLLMKAQNSDDDNAAVNSMDEYLDFLDEVAARYTGMSVEELDDLESEDKDKILLYYQERVSSRVDFLVSSLKQANS